MVLNIYLVELSAGEEPQSHKIVIKLGNDIRAIDHIERYSSLYLDQKSYIINHVLYLIATISNFPESG